MPSHPDSSRCSQHNVALGPDGTCVICRRELAVEAAPQRRSAAALGLPGWLVVCALLMVVGAGAARALQVLTHHSPPSAADMSAAAPRVVQITMYSTRWCGTCTRARAYMQHNSIAFTDFDVEHDAAAGMRLRQLNPRGSVPTIAIEDEVLIGFSAEAIDAAVERAARRLNGG